ncbi:hypothetical protein BDN72DRAFT_73954 [Pluteus cervinus]|uniref:Uncharacterized protein n=1 Tax=Pluteus cervinus TaxID=181527 RepID=A0ACD3AQ71_9AGAR|nr:hypothetical protein BDN72DRAFT_73954 [Pluteus cervinus]
MIRLCRAEDGQAFQVNATLRDIERLGSLELFIHQETGVEQEAILAYLSDGRRLTSANVRELAGSQDQTIFVFNKSLLECNVEEVVQQLTLTAALQPPIEESIAATPPFRPAQLAASYLRAAQAHHDTITQTLVNLHNQHEALRVASTSLDFHVLAIVDPFEGISANCRRELDKQSSLLAGVDTDLELISKIRIHAEFMSPAKRRSIEAGEKPRSLGDYVSDVRMRQVANTCTQTHGELRFRFGQVEQAISRLTRGADGIRQSLATTNFLEDGESCKRRTQDTLDRIAERVATLEGYVADPDTVIQELKRLDSATRSEVQFITDTKNAYTESCITILRHIGILNTDIVQLPPMLADLQASFRAKNSFPHIQRLHNMVYAYGATIIEIVRRKEFSQFFNQRAQSILEVMAKLSAGEKKRRQVYRGELGGQLPFETRGLDDPVPMFDYTSPGNTEVPYSMDRKDIDALLRVLDDLERYSQSKNDDKAVSVLQDCHAALSKLVQRMDNLETSFDRIAERSLLSASRLTASRRRSIEADEQIYHELTEQLRNADIRRLQLETQHQGERVNLQAEIDRLKESLQDAEVRASTEQERSNRLERELSQTQSQSEGEQNARRILEDRNAELSRNLEKQGVELAEALSAATNHARTAEHLRQEITQVRTEFEDVKALETRNGEKVANLLDEQAKNLRILEEARARGDDLETQIRAARAENETVNQALREASVEKDRLLRAQASEHDRIIRDHIAEADGDRAVLERQFFELKALQESTERQVRDLQTELNLAKTSGTGTREELERELREARQIERLLRDDLKAGQASATGFEQKLEEQGRLIAQILDVAITFQGSHLKALGAAQTVTAHAHSGPRPSAESTFPSGMRHSIIAHQDEPPPIDPSDPAAALEVLRSFDHDHFVEAVSKTGSTVRKWQKQCKEYRERAKGKISFRNFAKGDLALFLPTRNSVSKPWAAFNVSFPHYFLQATGHLAEQLKSREWIVARITSITERVVNHNDPTSNPYGLGDGVKYYMLEVEDWTQPTHTKRRVSSRKVSGEKESRELLLSSSVPALPPGPPEAEVEDTFQVTHPPNSQLFPVRTRSSSSPGARPSSLSRLLAQAAVTDPNAESSTSYPIPNLDIAEQSSPTAISPPATDVPAPPQQQTQVQSGQADLAQEQPALSAPSHSEPDPGLQTTKTSPRPPTSPSPIVGSIPQHVSIPSPLRPGSRSSRMSTTSKFSGRIPALGAVAGSSSAAKAAPTTALTEEPLISSASSGDGNPFVVIPSPPSPEGSISDGIANNLRDRRRTTSYHLPRTSPLASSRPVSGEGVVTSTSKPTLRATSTLANLATSWGMAFGRKKQAELATLTDVVETDADARGSSDRPTTDSTASDMLKGFRRD